MYKRNKIIIFLVAFIKICECLSFFGRFSIVSAEWVWTIKVCVNKSGLNCIKNFIKREKPVNGDKSNFSILFREWIESVCLVLVVKLLLSACMELSMLFVIIYDNPFQINNQI